jgi:hypothetical protein
MAFFLYLDGPNTGEKILTPEEALRECCDQADLDQEAHDRLLSMK